MVQLPKKIIALTYFCKIKSYCLDYPAQTLVKYGNSSGFEDMLMFDGGAK
jgi:hypothetical protein